jgi:hypothetical protein
MVDKSYVLVTDELNALGLAQHSNRDCQDIADLADPHNPDRAAAIRQAIAVYCTAEVARRMTPAHLRT